jgi:NAD(P)H-dependent FMN reductase
MQILGLCGSLRRESRSLVLLQAFAQLAPVDVQFVIHPGLGDLPLFNPDDETNPAPAVRELWRAVAAADAVAVASPEYAHGVTGTIKNALDWLVGCEDFVDMPVALLNPSHRAELADAALREILVTMNTRLIPGACLRIAATACALDAWELARDARYGSDVRAALAAIERFHREMPRQ